LAQLPARHNFSVTGDEFSRIRLSGRGWSAGRRAAMAGSIIKPTDISVPNA